MQTETLDKLYLEWSQFTKAKTAKELKLEARIEALEKQNEILQTECRGYDCCPLAPRLNRADDRVEALETRIQAAIEVYAGMEGFIPETAAEGYCLRIIEQMNKALQEQTP